MKKIRKNQKSAFNLHSLTLEGALFLPDQLEKAALGQASQQKDADYHVPTGLKLKDEYSRAFQIASAQWKQFAQHFERSDVDALALTQSFVKDLLQHAFAYHSIQTTAPILANERAYPVSFIAEQLPIVVAPFNVGLDESIELFAVEGSGSRKKSAFQLAQELLNASDQHLWAIATNGRQLRLLRDAASLTRPSFLEIDLEDILQAQRFSEFTNAWRLIHASRAPQSTQSTDSIWESWRATGQEEGTRVRDGLRQGVEQALLTLGTGFIQHPANSSLRQALDQGALSKDAYFQQLLRLVYRFIFLFTVEERGLLHPKDDSKQAQQARQAYAQGYALARLRELCLKRRARNRFDDHWQAIRIVFKGLQQGQPHLALPALGGLFASEQTPDLDSSSLSNADFLQAIQHLRWAVIAQGKSTNTIPVDYRNMGPEELGSVYESLLELVPTLNLSEKRFGFVGLTDEGSTAGNTRKLTGSYYTPDSLVQQLIQSALEPVIAQRLAANPASPTEALLSIRVVDPACGSGHFLLAAARRLAEELAQLRSLASGQEGAIKPQDYRHALREVIGQCIFGVDRNPMAIELARMALWLEGFAEGCPLNFLDHHLQVGDALLGLTDLNVLECGISKDAFKALSGDDKEVCKQLAAQNSNALKQLEKDRKSPQFKLPLEQNSQLAELQRIEAMPQNTLKQTTAQEAAYAAFLKKTQSSPLRNAADILVGTYLLPKTPVTQSQVPTTATLMLELMAGADNHNEQHQTQRQAALQACEDASVFHWPLAFPQVFAQGGFDCVLGNPPWELVQDRDGTLDKELHERQKEWFLSEAYSMLSGRRDLYKLFLAIVPRLLNSDGWCGLILPIGFMFESTSEKIRKIMFDKGSTVSILHLQNDKKIFFPDVHASYRFISLTYTNKIINTHKFSTVVKSPKDLQDVSWHEVKRSGFDGLLGLDRGAMLFESNEEARVHNKILLKILEKELLEYTVVSEFHASSDKEILKTEKDEDDWALLKNGSFHFYSPYFGPIEKWVNIADMKTRLIRKNLKPEIWSSSPRIVFRDIARNDDTRTLIACLVPPGFSSTYDAPMIVPKSEKSHSPIELAFYAGFLSSFLADFLIRPYVDKHIKGYVLAHIPIPKFDCKNKFMLDFAEHSFVLYKRSWKGINDSNTYQANSFDSERVALDALCLKFCGISKDDTVTIFDSFSSIKNNEMREFGEYRTQRLVLEAWDRL